MANTIPKSIHHNTTIQVVGLLLLLLIERGDAREFTINWTVPSDSNATNYDQWAEKNRFQINDSIVFKYAAGRDSVLHVDKDAYANCNTAKHFESFSDGHSVYTFKHSGSHYFISGVKDNCLKNEKLVVVVLANRSKASASPPSPGPTGQASPTPPAGTVEINPTPAPESPSPPSAASSALMSFTCSFAALAGSYLVLASLA